MDVYDSLSEQFSILYLFILIFTLLLPHGGSFVIVRKKNQDFYVSMLIMM